MKILKMWSDKRAQQHQFETLLKPHIEHLYRLAYRFCNNQTDAEDLVQELLVKIYPRTSEMCQIENLKPWLAKVLYRLFIDIVRKQSRSPVDLADTETETLENNPVTPLFQDSSEQENHRYLEQINTALQSLNTVQRELIIFHDVEGYTLNELEQILDTPVGTLKSRLSRSRLKLREQLMEPFPELERVKQVKG